MKLIVSFASFLLIVTTCSAQVDNIDEIYGRTPPGNPIDNHTPGDKLIRFTRVYYTGFAIEIVGGILIGVAQTGTHEESLTNGLTIAGGVLVLGGAIVQLVSFSSIGKAGKLMNEQQKRVSLNIESTQYGVGIVCRF